MSELGHQRPIENMPDLSPMDDGSERQPSSSGEEESDFEAHQPRQGKENIQMCEAHVTMNHHHLRADASIQVGTVISIGETMELHDKSFLTVTALGTSKDGRSVKFIGHLFKCIDGFQEYLPATSGGSELVWLCEAKEKIPKPEGYLRSACGKDVLRIRKLVLTDSDCAPETVAQCQATGMGMVTEPLFCRWRLVAELSDSHVMGGARMLRSILGGSKEKPKAFMSLSHQKLYNGENLATECCNSELGASGSTEGYFKVDILHLSPSCNGFSRAYRGPPRVAVKANECMTYVGAIVEKVKPRIVTFEEVREVLFRYREYFTTMIHNLTSMGYSVEWRLIECADLGLPQKRRRLFMIASW